MWRCSAEDKDTVAGTAFVSLLRTLGIEKPKIPGVHRNQLRVTLERSAWNPVK